MIAVYVMFLFILFFLFFCVVVVVFHIDVNTLNCNQIVTFTATGLKQDYRPGESLLDEIRL